MCPDPCSMKERTRAGKTKDLAEGARNDLAAGIGMQSLLLQPRTDESKREDIGLSRCHPA